MKMSRIQKSILYFIVGLVVLYLVYKAYKNYQANGSVFKTSNGCLPGMVGCDTGSTRPMPIIYKTNANYNNNVPILLSEDKTQIVAYPDPTDIKIGDKFATPTLLNEGYLLDNRGIGKNSVFLSITYEEYSKLSNPPSLSEMMKMIIDNDPFSEMYITDNVYSITDLNKIIDDKQLSKFKKII